MTRGLRKITPWETVQVAVIRAGRCSDTPDDFQRRCELHGDRSYGIDKRS